MDALFFFFSVRRSQPLGGPLAVCSPRVAAFCLLPSLFFFTRSDRCSLFFAAAQRFFSFSPQALFTSSQLPFAALLFSSSLKKTSSPKKVAVRFNDWDAPPFLEPCVFFLPPCTFDSIAFYPGRSAFLEKSLGGLRPLPIIALPRMTMTGDLFLCEAAGLFSSPNG